MAETKVIVIPEGKICDYIDGKFRNDTPEEYVRQTIEKRLINEHKYLPNQIKFEILLYLIKSVLYRLRKMLSLLLNVKKKLLMLGMQKMELNN